MISHPLPLSQQSVLTEFEGFEIHKESIGIQFARAKLRVEPLSAAPDRTWLMRLDSVSHRAHRCR